MFTRLQITVALAVTTIAWGAVLWAQGTTLSWEHLAPFTVVVGVLVLVGLAMEHLFWRLRIFQG